MNFAKQIKNLREKNNLSQEAFAENLSVTRQAVSKWETGRGYPDIENLIGISNIFDISLDELIKNDKCLESKIITQSSSKKWHKLVIVFLVSIIGYILYFAIFHRIFMIGFGIATLFMLGIELRIFLKERIYLQKDNR